MSVDVGNVENPNPCILPQRVITLSDSTSILAGNIVKSGPHFGMLQDSVTTSGQKRGLVMNQIMRILAKSGTGTEISDGAAITLTQVTDEDWYQAELAGEGDEIHGYAMEAKAAGGTDVKIKGPLPAPFTTIPVEETP
jgi:hypothetical protein